MAKWIKLGSEADFTEPVKVYEYKDQSIALFKLDTGFYAINDACSHDEASLAEGEIDNHHIECPRHGALFDIKTGKNLSLPAVFPVRSFPVKVENGEIFLQIED